MTTPTKHRGTDLEAAFLYWLRVLCPHVAPPVSEFQFCEGRGWRADFAFVDARVLIECEGREHVLPATYAKDIEKYNRASLEGWTLLRCTTPMLKDNPEDFIRLVQSALTKKV